MSSSEESELDAEAKARKHCRNVVNEMIHTEKAYSSSLVNLVENFYEPLAQKLAPDSDETPVLTSQQMAVIFGNVTELCRLHKNLLKDMEVQGTEGDMGKVFQEFSPYLKMYTAYLNNNAAGLCCVHVMSCHVMWGMPFFAFF